MSDINNGASAATFLIPIYVSILYYFALVHVPYAGLVDVLSLMHVVKSASACVTFISLIEFT
jgi:hypothetical protein